MMRDSISSGSTYRNHRLLYCRAIRSGSLCKENTKEACPSVTASLFND